MIVIKKRDSAGKPIAGLDPVMDLIYRARDIKDISDVQYELSDLLSYRLLKDIGKACQLLHAIFLNQQKVIVIGDYDVDGATATSVIVSGLREMGFKYVDFIIPNRVTDGYGLTPKLVDRAKDQQADLIITVDNGIVSHAGVDHANKLGIKVLITDHHLAADTVPSAVIINPNQPGCEFPSKCIAGVGVAFYVLVALRAYFREQGVFDKGPNLLAYLDLVALGTVADCVKLDVNNRRMVAHGLEVMRKGRARYGIQALIKVAKRNPTLIEADDMGFSLAPRLNAAGRLEDMTTGVQCLLADNARDAMYFSLMLDEINLTRRQMQQDMTDEALNFVQSFTNLPKIAVVCKPKWHEGIIGLVASMIKEKYNIPCIVLTQDENQEWFKGSCRSIAGLNIRDVLAEYDRRHPGSLVKFGGHAMAAGLTILASDIEKFTQVLTEICVDWITQEMCQKYLWVDGSLPSTHRTMGFAREIIKKGPWGNGFEKPMFFDQFEIAEQYIVGGKHLKVVLTDGEQNYDAIFFNIEEGMWPDHHTKTVECAYHLQINEFNGRRKVQFLITSMRKLTN